MGKILVLTGQDASVNKEKALKNRGVRIIRIPRVSQALDLKKALQRLGQEGISSVFVEGGGRLLTSLLEGKHIDKMYVTISPKLIGGMKAPSFFQGQGVEDVKEALFLKKTRSFVIDEDIIMEGYF
jgi:diaminohydroxyphosphoribosylaminopyrimidine deaminase/5-amino-6-(5-phosphoribosylamino)uracil reductase